MSVDPHPEYLVTSDYNFSVYDYKLLKFLHNGYIMFYHNQNRQLS